MLLVSQKRSSYSLLKFCLRHQSVTLFLCGAPPPKRNPGSAPGRDGAFSSESLKWDADGWLKGVYVFSKVSAGTGSIF